jgi:hypothetical protein
MQDESRRIRIASASAHERADDHESEQRPAATDPLRDEVLVR